MPIWLHLGPPRRQPRVTKARTLWGEPHLWLVPIAWIPSEKEKCVVWHGHRALPGERIQTLSEVVKHL